MGDGRVLACVDAHPLRWDSGRASRDDVVEYAFVQSLQSGGANDMAALLLVNLIFVAWPSHTAAISDLIMV